MLIPKSSVLSPAVKYPGIDFEIKEFAGGVMVIFQQSGAISEGVSKGVNEGVGEGVSRLLEVIRQQPGLRAPALATLLNTSPKNVERWLKQLRNANRIEFIGSSKTGGYYPVKQQATK